MGGQGQGARRRWGQVLRGTLCATSLLVAMGVGAQTADRPAAAEAAPVVPLPPALEQRFQALASRLRCVVCQNQSLADSPAELATDLKQVVREQLQAGASDEAVLDFMVLRYGEAVLYQPRLKAETGLLWFGPVLVLGSGLLLLGRQLRRTVTAEEVQP